MSYQLSETSSGVPFIRCLHCGRASFNRNDIEHRYCGNCHVFHDPLGATTEIVASECPACGATHTAATSAIGDTEAPKANDLSVCIKCGNWNVFDDDLRLRAITESEIAALPDVMFQELSRASKLISKIHERRKIK